MLHPESRGSLLLVFAIIPRADHFMAVAVPRACLFSSYLQMTLSANHHSLADRSRWCAVSGLALQELQWWASSFSGPNLSGNHQGCFSLRLGDLLG